jgi:hypothetical protein
LIFLTGNKIQNINTGVGKRNFQKIKKTWDGPIFEERAGMIIYQLS